MVREALADAVPKERKIVELADFIPIYLVLGTLGDYALISASQLPTNSPNEAFL